MLSAVRLLALRLVKSFLSVVPFLNILLNTPQFSSKSYRTLFMGCLWCFFINFQNFTMWKTVAWTFCKITLFMIHGKKINVFGMT